jgi:hypothetical protein
VYSGDDGSENDVVTLSLRSVQNALFHILINPDAVAAALRYDVRSRRVNSIDSFVVDKTDAICEFSCRLRQATQHTLT